MSWTTKDIPDLTGTVALVTGANAGLGFETTRALAAAGARVLMGARDPGKAETARERILAEHPTALIDLLSLDLANLDSVRAAAASILDQHHELDLLINNAGVMAIPERRTVDGFEMQFGTNHLGHWALTSLLMPALATAEAARVVTVTSTAHHFGRAVDPDNPHLHGRYQPWQAYSQSKLANFHFGIGLQRRMEAAGLPTASLLAHPGLSNTDLQMTSVAESGGGWSQRIAHRASSRTGMTPAQGALPQLRAATDPDARGGEFYAPRFANFGPPVRRPILRRLGLDQAIETLWEVSERETGISLELSRP